MWGDWVAGSLVSAVSPQRVFVLPAQVLGPVLAKAPSVGLAIVSIAAFVTGTYCIHETNILHTVSPETIQPLYVLGAALVPISWGLHVASWIQKQNGM